MVFVAWLSFVPGQRFLCREETQLVCLLIRISYLGKNCMFNNVTMCLLGFVSHCSGSGAYKGLRLCHGVIGLCHSKFCLVNHLLTMTRRFPRLYQSNEALKVKSRYSLMFKSYINTSPFLHCDCMFNICLVWNFNQHQIQAMCSSLGLNSQLIRASCQPTTAVCFTAEANGALHFHWDTWTAPCLQTNFNKLCCR